MLFVLHWDLKTSNVLKIRRTALTMNCFHDASDWCELSFYLPCRIVLLIKYHEGAFDQHLNSGGGRQGGEWTPHLTPEQQPQLERNFDSGYICIWGSFKTFFVHIYHLLTGCKGCARKYKPMVFHTARACEGCLENQGLVFPGTARAPS